MEPGAGPQEEVRTSHNTRDAALDGIRGLAALGVLVLHVAGNTGVMYGDGMFAWMTTRLGVAVPIFFLLSGLLLYRPWAEAALGDRTPPRTGRYLLRRVLRVMPAYWVVTALALWAWSSLDWAGWARWLLLLQNYGEQKRAPDGLYQMWTLPIEMAFYVILPLLAWALSRWAKGSPVRLLWGIAVLPLISLAALVVAHVSDNPEMALWLPQHLIYFAAGMAMAVLVAWRKQGGVPALSRVVDSIAPQLLVLAVLCFCVLATELAGPRTLELPSLWQGFWRMVLETAVAVLVVAPFALAHRPGSTRDRVLGNRVAAYLGRISYSVFLWHAAVITFYYKVTDSATFSGDFLLVLGFTLVITALVATASYHLIEHPLSVRRSAPAPRQPESPAPEPVAPVP